MHNLTFYKEKDHMIPNRKHFGALLLGLTMTLGLTTSILTPNTAKAQAVSGDITGVVMDSNKAVIVRANVVATNVATGIAYTATTNGVGEYRLGNLPPGTYDIAVSATGFSKSVTKGFAVELNKISTANVTLKVVTTIETVEVSAAGVALDTTTAQLETSFTSQQLTELPAATNNVLNLSLMTAGVASSGGVGQGTGPSVGGQRPTDNNYMVEGIDNNDKSVPGPLLYVPSDAVSQFTALQNQYLGRIWPLQWRPVQPDHQERHQPVPRPGLRVLAESQLQRGRCGPGAQQRRSGLDAGSPPLRRQPLRRPGRRPDHEEQALLLCQL